MNGCLRCSDIVPIDICRCEDACPDVRVPCAARQGDDLARAAEVRMSPFERRRRAGQLPVADITGHRAPVL